MSPCIIHPRYRMLPVIAFPLCAVFALVGKVDPEATVLHAEVQVEIFATSFQAHPPVIVLHCSR